MDWKKLLITNLVQSLLTFLSPTALKSIADAVLDMAEDAIKDSENTIDDTVLNPIIEAVRAAFNIPDNDTPNVRPIEAP